MSCGHDESWKAVRDGRMICFGCQADTDFPEQVEAAALPAAVPDPDSELVDTVAAVVRMLRQRAAMADVERRPHDGAAYRLAIQVILQMSRHHGLPTDPNQPLIRALR